MIERPAPPPGIVAPFPERAEWWPGCLLAWRWVDRAQRTWTALVRYQHEGLHCEHWVCGEIVDIEAQVGEASVRRTPKDLHRRPRTAVAPHSATLTYTGRSVNRSEPCTPGGRHPLP